MSKYIHRSTGPPVIFITQKEHSALKGSASNSFNRVFPATERIIYLVVSWYSV